MAAKETDRVTDPERNIAMFKKMQGWLKDGSFSDRLAEAVKKLEA